MDLLKPNFQKNSQLVAKVASFAHNLTLCIKSVEQIEEFEENKDFHALDIISPFTFMSLPALLYEKRSKNAFHPLRNRQRSGNPLSFNEDGLAESFVEVIFLLAILF